MQVKAKRVTPLLHQKLDTPRKQLYVHLIRFVERSDRAVDDSARNASHSHLFENTVLFHHHPTNAAATPVMPNR
jgi:hypothetical protein